MTAEASARPLVGFRSWRLSNDGELRPLTEKGSDNDPLWAVPGRSTTALCPRLSAPGLCERALTDCGCGFWAHDRLTPKPGYHERQGPLTVHGAVLAWGRIAVHRRGFRAEHAQPIAFLAPGRPGLRLDDPPPVKRAIGRYGLPVLEGEELVAYAAWHGDRVVP
jgi:hypothetical protein